MLAYQVDDFTKGDFQVVQERAKNVKFQPGRDTRIVNRYKHPKEITDTGFPLQGEKQEVLMERFFTKSTRPLANMVHITEKIKARAIMQATRLDRMLDRVDLDRGLLINEKM